jgi:uncharacterized membrane-anchored protein
MNTLTAEPSNSSFRTILSKVPEVTIFFWIIKVLCTTVGETASDFLNVNLNFGLTGTSLITGIILAVVLFVQFTTKKYTPALYWLTVVLVSVFGTLVTDYMSTNLNVPLETSTIVFTGLLAATFGIWYALEKTLSIHSIFTRRREALYWLAILFTFALGTASGDLISEGLGFGYFNTGLIVISVIAVFALAWRAGLNAILSFWFIYIMTRPLGASLGDFLSQSGEHGGLGLGATITSVIFLAGIVFTVAFLSLSKKDEVTDPFKEEQKDEAESTHGLLQLIVVSALLLVGSVGGYYWREAQLRNSAPTPSASAPGAEAPPLGDLTQFTTITQDMLTMVTANNLPGATKRADDLEYAWDTSQARLKPMNGTAWTKVDGGIDKVLREVRAVNPNQATSKAALETLLGDLKNPTP